MPRAEGQTNVPFREFMKAVLSSDSHAEVAQKTGLSVGGVGVRISNYRKKGYKMPEFARKGRSSLSVEEANSIIDELRAELEGSDKEG